MNYVDELQQFRHQKDQFFKSHPQSPLTPEQREPFTALRYYDADPALNLIVQVTPFAEQDDVPVPTTTGEVRLYTRYGEFTFEVDGQTARLTIYEAPHGFFLPFADANAGGETYGAGRYLEPEELGNNRFRVDFNLAYNPYCAYSPQWSCPLTPAENRLKVAIRAGEQVPDPSWASH